MTSKIQFRGSTSGFVELSAPDAAGSNTLILPSGTGGSGDFLRTDGSGSLSFAAVTDNGFESYAVICDQKTQDTDAGTFSNGAWRTRDLNTEILDPDGIVTISSNQFTLAAGSYLIEWLAPAVRVGPHKARLYDVTGDASVQIGPNAFTSTDGGDATFAFGSARVTPASSNTYRIEHRCEDGSALGYSFGYRTNFPSTPEIYTVVKIFKEA
jgi:hypothetical protein